MLVVEPEAVPSEDPADPDDVEDDDDDLSDDDFSDDDLSDDDLSDDFSPAPADLPFDAARLSLRLSVR